MTSPPSFASCCALVPLLTLATACAGPTDDATASALVALPEGEAIGEPLEARPILRFADVHATPSAYYDQTLLVEARVVEVCRKAGCWMQIVDETATGEPATAMVRWEAGCGGRYTFPEASTGRRVVIQGSFYPKTIAPEDAAHLEEEAGGTLDVPLEGYEFNASAVLLLARG